MIIQFIVCLFATLSFAVLFHAPKAELVFCGLSGAFGWIVYLLCINSGISKPFANLVATLTLTVAARTTSAIRRNPVTVYLICGIFPLVPGAGIYYTSYYFIMNMPELCGASGMDTVKSAGSIVLGILAGFALPQSWFNMLGQRNRKKTSGPDPAE